MRYLRVSRISAALVVTPGGSSVRASALTRSLPLLFDSAFLPFFESFAVTFFSSPLAILYSPLATCLSFESRASLPTQVAPSSSPQTTGHFGLPLLVGLGGLGRDLGPVALAACPDHILRVGGQRVEAELAVHLVSAAQGVDRVVANAVVEIRTVVAEELVVPARPDQQVVSAHSHELVRGAIAHQGVAAVAAGQPFEAGDVVALERHTAALPDRRTRERKRAPEGALWFRRTYRQLPVSWPVGPLSP